MAEASELVAVIRGFDRPRLLTLYDQIVWGDTPGWRGGKALEHLSLRAFELEGAEVQWPYEVPMPTSDRTMEQIDGVLYVDGLAILVETKDVAERANIEPIAKLKSQLDRRPPQTLGLVISRSGFTFPAATLTQLISGGRIILWRGDEMRYALANTLMVPALKRKYRALIERAVPDLIIIPEEEFQPPADLTQGDSNGTHAPGE